MEERLDCALASTLWRDRFPSATVNHLLWTGSDHLPVLLNMANSIPATVQGYKQFDFEAIWVYLLSRCDSFLL